MTDFTEQNWNELAAEGDAKILKHYEMELIRTRALYREALAEIRRLRLVVATAADEGQFEIGAQLRDKRENKS